MIFFWEGQNGTFWDIFRRSHPADAFHRRTIHLFCSLVKRRPTTHRLTDATAEWSRSDQTDSSEAVVVCAVRRRNTHLVTSGMNARMKRIVINSQDKMSFGDCNCISSVPARTYRKQLGRIPIALTQKNVLTRILVKPIVALTAKNGTTGDRRSIRRYWAPSRSIPLSTSASQRPNQRRMKSRNKYRLARKAHVIPSADATRINPTPFHMSNSAPAVRLRMLPT